MRNRGGVGKGEVLGFLVLLGVAVAVGIYFNTPKVIVRTVVVQAPPPAPVPPPPVPVVTQPKAEVRTAVEPPAPPAELPKAVVVYTPPTPECVVIQKRLLIALEAAIQTETDLVSAKKAALDALRQSSDYQVLKADLEQKKKAKDDALSALRQDNAAGNDTDQDNANVQAASLAWATQIGVINGLENETVANDQTVMRKVQDLKDIRNEILSEQINLADYIKREINSVCDHSECQINAVKFDADKWTIDVDMTPVTRESSGAMADAALTDIGTVLETLSKSPFMWQKIRFKVFGQTGDAVEYQLTYARNALIDTDFELLHAVNLLYHPIHTADLRIGAEGILFDVKIMNIIDESNMIVWLDESVENIDDLVRPVWIRGLDTTGKVDESNLDILTPLKVTGTIQYTTATGASKTVFLLEPAGFKENIVIGDYYDNTKLISLAQNVWLNSAIDRLQGRRAIPDFYIRQPGMTAPELVNTLQVGGYTRSDGSICPETLVHTPHPVWASQPDPPINRTPSLPSRYDNSNPMILDHPPAP